MRRRLTSDKRIFFPWESRGGLARWLRLGQVRPVLIGLAAVGFFVMVGVHERREAGIRLTRARLIDARRAVDAYLAEHEGVCPPAVASVARHTRSNSVPEDAWGRPFRLVCPGNREAERYQLMSDGPDGEPGGLDRIE
jgi:general secretion pathway protein G